jgi:hypothetical protein
MTNYHAAHKAYVGAVADSLSTAGFEVLDRYADPNDPRDGGIQVRPVGGYQAVEELWLGWSEDRGWWVLTITDPHGRDSRFVYDLDPGRVLSPETVVRYFAEMADVPANVHGDRYPDLAFIDHSFEDDDPEFEAALAAYRTEGAAE